jgi:DNA-binding response OmpR family regulator
MAYVLIIDDDEDFALATATALRSFGHEVSICLDPRRAVAVAAERTPELVILDVMFPEDSSAGFGLARELRRANDQLKRVPVLMLTAVNSRFPLGFNRHDIDEEWLPVTDFVEKPMDLDALQLKVAELLRQPRH